MKIIFLDRDGVINRYPGDKQYVTSLKKFRFLSGAKKAIAKLNRKGFKVFVASNQGGVGKGAYAQKTLDFITEKMLREIERCGGKIEKVYYCTHRKQDNCVCRKPKIGLLKKASREFRFKLKGAYFIGDTIRDIITAKRSGCQSVLVLSGKEKLNNRNNWKVQPDFVFKDLKQASAHL